MKILTAILTVSILAFYMGGCGVKEEIHNKALKDLADTDATLQIKQQELDECQKTLTGCQTEIENVKSDLNALGAEHENLGKAHNQLDATYLDVKDQLAKIRKANDLRQKAMNQLLADFASLIASGKLSIGVNDGRMVIQLPSNLLFKVGSARLSKEGKAALTEVNEVLKGIKNRKFQIAGHTDNQRKSKRTNPNWALSYKRALAVFDLLVKNEMDESLLSIAAYAEYSPVETNETKEGRAKNRRIEIVLLPNSDEVPLKQLKMIKSVEKKIEGK